MPEINGISVPFVPAGGPQVLQKRHQVPVDDRALQPSFNELFQQEVEKLKFSGHAQSRLNSREIPLTSEDIEKLEGAVQKAELKGARESLILYNDMAFVVSVPNRTVITAMHSEQLRDSVFTNIDSAVIAS